MALLVLIVMTLALGIATFALGNVPLMCRLSQAKIRSFSVYGTGLLVGAALSIVIPEGIEAIYKNEETDTHHDEHQHHTQSKWVALALLSGFLFMWLIDQLQSHVHTHPKQSTKITEDQQQPFMYRQRNHSLIFARRISSRLPNDNCLENGRPSLDGNDSAPLLKSLAIASDTPRSPKKDDDNYFRPNHAVNTLGLGLPPSGNKLDVSSSEDASSVSSGISVHAGERARSLSTTIGLVVHSLADGISLGASSAATASAGAKSGALSLDVIVFIAIIVHKAPAAFGLVTVLMGDAWSRTKIRKALLAFALAAPIGAILTYGILQLFSGRSGEMTSLGWWTGLALLFSGGNFLFVATHIMQETAPEEEEHGRQKLWTTILMCLGMISPMALQQLVGHAH